MLRRTVKMLGKLRSILFLLFLSFSSLSWSSFLVRLLETDEAAAVARIRALQRARQEINGLYFIFGKDESALRGLAVAREAALRHGVRSRLIIDGMFNSIPPAMIRHLSDIGVHIRVYNPFRLRQVMDLSFLHRMHEKGICVDGLISHIGGRNAESAYFGKDQIRPNYIDRDLEIWSKEFCDQFNAYFNELWANADRVSEADFSDVKNSEVIAASEKLQRVHDELMLGYADPKWDAIDAAIPAFEVATVPVLLRRTNEKTMAQVVTEEIQQAEESVFKESPYFVLTPEMHALMQHEINVRGIHWRLLTNSPFSSDGVIAAAAYRNDRPRAARTGLELWEFNGPRSLHSKTAVIDRKRVLVGTFNMDPRSQNVNGEWGVRVDSPELAAAILKTMDENIANSSLAAKGGIEYPENVKAISKPRGFKRQVIYNCSRPLARIPFIKNQI